MNKEAYILSGMFLGDEGKGTFIDYLANEIGISQFVKYNGGSQASHTVVTKSNTHKFSQLSSGMLIPNGKTYLSENTVINPMNLLTEIETFAEKFNRNPKDILNSVVINDNAYIVTPYHKLINKLKELSSAYQRRGSVGTGVSEVMSLLRDIGVGIKFKELYDEETLSKKIAELKLYTVSFLKNNISLIKQDQYDSLIDKKEVSLLVSESNIILNQYLDMINNIPFKTGTFESFLDNNSIIFEGSQGLLLDYRYGLRPNTTKLDTTNKYAVEMVAPYDYNVIKIGIASAFASRHGLGVLPTENNEVSIIDRNQQITYWQGNPRYGWFDAVLFRYSQMINDVDELYLSSLDLLSNLKTLKICNEYEYQGLLSDEFKSMFNYYIIGQKIIVTDIKKINENITIYLKQMIPIYIEVKGWNSDISNITSLDFLPDKCLDYIKKIEELTGIRISLVSVGPKREQKIRRKK